MGYTKSKGKGKRVYPNNWRADLIKVPNPIDRARVKELYNNGMKNGAPFMLEKEMVDKHTAIKLMQSARQQKIKEYRSLSLIKTELLQLNIFIGGDEAVFVEDNWATGWRKFSETYPSYARAMFYYNNGTILWRNYKEKLSPKNE